MGGKTHSWGVKRDKEEVFDRHTGSDTFRGVSTLDGFGGTKTWAWIELPTLSKQDVPRLLR